MNRRAQVSVEFLLILGVVALAFVIGLSLIFDFIGDTMTSQDKQSLQELADVIESETFLAKSVEDNYERTFFLPMQVRGTTYNITVKNYIPNISNYSEVVLTLPPEVSSDDYEQVIFLYKVDVSSLSFGENKIKKKDNQLYICNVNSGEICDGKDNDCNEIVDDGCDNDQDGYLDGSLGCVYDELDETFIPICADAYGVAEPVRPCVFDCSELDCDDNNPDVIPGGIEICNGIDDDCDLFTAPDSELPIELSYLWMTGLDEGCDSDQDGYIDADDSIACSAGAVCMADDGKTKVLDCNNGCELDCDSITSDDPYTCPLDVEDCVYFVGVDSECAICKHPGIIDGPDKVDNNCNGDVDEDTSTIYCDKDGDGYNATYGSSAYVTGCFQEGVYSPGPNDCHDDPAVFPNAANANPGMTYEICDGMDNECDAGYQRSSDPSSYLFVVGTDEGCDDDDDGYVDKAMECDVLQWNVIAGNKACSYADCNDDLPSTPSCEDINPYSCSGNVWTEVSYVCNDQTSFCDMTVLDTFDCNGDVDGIPCTVHNCAETAQKFIIDSSACSCTSASDAIVCSTAAGFDAECREYYCNSFYACEYDNINEAGDCNFDETLCSNDLRSVIFRDYSCESGDCVYADNTVSSCASNEVCNPSSLSCCRPANTGCSANSQCCDGSCNSYSCNKHNCNPHDCDCAWGSCKTCYDTCYDTCYKC